MGKKLSKSAIKDLRDSGVEFSESEIRDWYKEYKRSCKRGQRFLTVNEFRTLYDQLFPGDARRFAEHMFRAFDTNHDNTVDFKEFVIGLSVTSSANPETKLKWAFDMYDINGDGRISRAEMTEILRSVYSMTGAGIKRHSGISSPDQMADKLFQDMDRNRDNDVSWEEFRMGALKDQTLIDLLQVDPNSL